MFEKVKDLFKKVGKVISKYRGKVCPEVVEIYEKVQLSLPTSNLPVSKKISAMVVIHMATNNLSDLDCAKKLKMSIPTFYKILFGDISITFYNMMKVLTIFKIKPEAIGFRPITIYQDLNKQITIPDKLIFLRNSKYLNILDISKVSGCSTATIDKIERGETSLFNMRWRDVRNYLNALEIDPISIIGDDFTLNLEKKYELPTIRNTYSKKIYLIASPIEK